MHKLTMADSPSILIVGAGGIGAFYGSALARQGAEVSVVCRSDYDVVDRDGYQIHSELLGDHRFRPHRVLRSVTECTVPPDYVILTVKVLPEVDRAALIRPAVGPRTTIVLIENGIDIEPEVATAFPDNEILSGLAFAGIVHVAAGEIHHQSGGLLTLGRFPHGVTPAAQRIGAILELSGVRCSLAEDIVATRWQKAVWNAVFNPVSILGGVLDTAMMLRTEENRGFIARAMKEVCDVAAAAGRPLSPHLIDRFITHTQKMPAYKTSMAQDFESGKPLEIEAIIGNPVRTGSRLGVATPTLATIYALAVMVAGSKK